MHLWAYQAQQILGIGIPKWKHTHIYNLCLHVAYILVDEDSCFACVFIFQYFQVLCCAQSLSGVQLFVTP